MTVNTVCLSHAPIKGMIKLRDEEAEPLIDEKLDEVNKWIVDYDPELVVVFGPDHYQGFFYELMPSFCVGIEASSIGDWAGPTGPVNVDGDTALSLIKDVQAKGFDVAYSRKMSIDHGIAQPLDWLKLGITKYPILPIFVNCAAEPQPPFSRVRQFGAAVGDYLKGLDTRVLVIGSGGLSHDPPLPRIDYSPPEVQEMLVSKHVPTDEQQESFVQFVLEEAQALADGKSKCLMPSEKFDREFLDVLASQDLESLDNKFTDDEIYKMAGCGGHEIRNWVAACAAQQAAEGGYNAELLYYRIVPEWMTGMSIMKATSA